MDTKLITAPVTAGGLASASYHSLTTMRRPPGRSSIFPQQTGHSGVHESDGWTPKPTPAPGPPSESDSVLSILKRDTTNTWENDKTCGWMFRKSSSPWTCPSEYTCATNNNIVGCVSGTYSPFYSNCLDEEAYDRGVCSSAGTETGCCHASGFGACGTFHWTGNPAKTMYRCFAEPTFISLQDEPQFVLDARTSTDTATTSSAIASSSTSRLPFVVPHGEHHPTSHTGAIVGGVIGGLVMLALFTGLLFWLHRRRRRRSIIHTQMRRTYPPPSPYTTRAGALSPAPAYELQKTSGSNPFKHDEDAPNSSPLHGTGMQQGSVGGNRSETAGSSGNPVEIGNAK